MTTGGSAITDELKALIGKGMDPMIHEVERGAIRRFADAIGDPNPLFRDVDYAKKAGHPDLVAPIGFFGWTLGRGGMMELMGDIVMAMARAGFPRLLDGGMEYEYYLPAHAGDVLTSYGKIVDISEREGRTGKMLITTMETTYVNQNGNLVAKARASFINR